jgi:ABC-type antimicrobial peptide transport system permease subunit
VILNLPIPQAIPSDSPLGQKQETIRRARLTVAAILPTEGPGAFSLRPNQREPLVAFVPLDNLRQRLEYEEQVNTSFLSLRNDLATTAASSQAQLQSLGERLEPTFADLGLALTRTEEGLVVVTSRQMVFPDQRSHAVKRALADVPTQSAIVYLAESIEDLDQRDREDEETENPSRAIPYSTVAGLEYPPEGSDLFWPNTPDGKPLPELGPRDIALSRWAAEQMNAELGDRIRLMYFEPESSHGEVETRSAGFMVRGIFEMEGPAGSPFLVPEMKGITDKLEIGEWNPPFPFEADRIEDADEQYWEQYRATPKAFVSLKAAKKLWGSRFGSTTSLVFSAEDFQRKYDLAPKRTIEAALADRLDPATFGLLLQPVRRRSLQASEGTTPFEALFLAFSFFIIASALMLIWMLFRLSVELKARRVGTLLAVGWTRRDVSRLLGRSALAVAVVSAPVGVLLGIGYAWLMIFGLTTWWVGAIGTPFLELHITAKSLMGGFLISILLCWGTILWSLRGMTKIPLRQLHAGQIEADSIPAASGLGFLTRLFRPESRVRKVLDFMVIAAVIAAAVLLADRLRRETAAGVFFGIGAALLLYLLVELRSELKSRALRRSTLKSLYQLSRDNAARHPGRSVLTVALMASTLFLIASIGAFRVDPTEKDPSLHSGNGGFALVGQTDVPVLFDLNTEPGRYELGMQQEDREILDRAGAKIYGLRTRQGENASCTNLYQTSSPRVLAVGEAMIDRDGFDWAASASGEGVPGAEQNPWRLLQQEVPKDPESGLPQWVPVVLDQNTAMYSLHLYQGVGERFSIPGPSGEPIPLKVVGLLSGSIFQGEVIMSEKHFEQLFPEISGDRYFLVEFSYSSSEEKRRRVAQVLERTLGDYGLVEETTGERLARFLAIQNTYLSTFQSLGLLGLLLGTFGLAIVQLRNVIQRRGELALLMATGFRRRDLIRLVLLENAYLLGTALYFGLLTALVALLPHLIGRIAAIPWATLVFLVAALLVIGLGSSAWAVARLARLTPGTVLAEERNA